MDEKNEALAGDRKMSIFEILRHSKPYIAKEKFAIILSMFLIALTVGVDILLPYLTSRFVERLQSPFDNETLKIVIGIVLGYGALGLANQAIAYFQAMTLVKAGQRIVYQLRMEVFTHIESMSQNQFNQMATGSLVTRVANYTASVSDLFTSVLVNLIKNILTVLGVLVFMMVISIQLSLYLLIFAAVTGVSSFFFDYVFQKSEMILRRPKRT